MKPFKHFNVLKTGNGFGIAVADLDPVEEDRITKDLRRLKINVNGVKFHPNYYPYEDRMINAWIIPAEPEAIEPMLNILKDHEFVMTVEARDLITQVIESIAEIEKQQDENRVLSSAQNGVPVEVPGLVGDLRGYQYAAVDWIVRNRRVYIGDEMGTGKTLSALAAMIVLGSFPVVVVCPASVKMGWVRQIKKFFPNMEDKIYVCNGRTTTPIPHDAEIVIINYDILSYWLACIQNHGYEAVILDEAHFIKSRKAKRTRAAISLARGADIRIAMSGTPVVSRPIDLVSQLEALDRMKDMTRGRSAWWFIERYCRPTHNGYGWDTRGASNAFELGENLRKHGILIRRRKEDVLDDLPIKQRVSLPLPIDNREEYNKVRDDIAYWVRQQVMADEKFAEELQGLSENDAARLWHDHIEKKIARARAAIAITKLSALRRVCMRGKMKATIEWIEDFLTSDEKIVVFCTHREAVNTLHKHFGSKAVKIIGGMGADARQEAIDAFVDNDDVKIVVANIDAAAEGIDGWQHVCSNVAFVELTWTPSKHHQAEDRCHRSGQQNPVTCYYLMAVDTIDEYLARMIDGKHAMISAIVDGEEVGQDTKILVDLMRRIAEGEF
jgi:hypothetical protein